MGSGKISYAGVAAAVGGVVGIIGAMAGWWETGDTVFRATADVSGTLAFVMALGAFVFGGAYVLMADAQIRRAFGALMTLCAVVLVLAAIWGLTRAGSVAAGASVATGMYLSLLGAILAIGGGFLWMRDAQESDARRSTAA
ncbi:MAG: hypothetical protein KatS3mg013_1878 [Actinomycetota bacterium]|jgi:hypothetical protein|nr:MAG: hypothetical protein KatS3mg013_1878 [Actinomycetota bacterium]